uniref:Uncharacterized protein n=1 Tax=Anguilla anguilla TaxID=7936 RepID=A0A0E9UXG5_ANGAN
MRKSSTSPPKPSIAFSIFILFTVNQMDKQFYWGDHYIILHYRHLADTLIQSD